MEINYRNIAKYRDMVKDSHKNVLPFLSSLRDDSEFTINKIKKWGQFPFKTKLEPFRVSDKETCNQKINKDLADIKGRTKRISNASYRWHNKSGSEIKNSCLFESTLRQTSPKFYKRNSFKDILKNKKKPIVEKRMYT